MVGTKDIKKTHMSRDKKLFIAGGVTLVVAIVALVVTLIVLINKRQEISDGSGSSIDSNTGLSVAATQVQNKAQQAYDDNDNDITKANEIFAQAIEEASNGKPTTDLNSADQAKVNNLVLAQMMMLLNNDQSAEVLAIKDRANPETMSDADQSTYYSYIASALTLTGGSEEEIKHYNELSYEANYRRFGAASEGESE